MNSEDKIGIVLFHKNIIQLYKQSWIDRCLDSLDNQDFPKENLQYYEIDYGNTNNQIKESSKFWNADYPNYAYAMNFIIQKAFDDGCKYVFNVNLDDFYHPNRFKEQIERIKKDGLDIVSSNFYYFLEVDNEIKLTRDMNFTESTDIALNFYHENNVIAHPAVCLTKNFWNDAENRYNPDLVPKEDFDLSLKISLDKKEMVISNKIGSNLFIKLN
jgi:hypothetical protein